MARGLNLFRYMTEMNDRDLKQRTLGTISFSLVAHAGLIAILVFSQQPSANEVTIEPEAVTAVAAEVQPIEVASNDETPTIAVNEEEDATITEAPAATPVPTPVPKQKAIRSKKAAARESIPQQQPEKLSSDIETPKNEQAELAAANADTETETHTKKTTAKATPTVIPSKHRAKLDDRINEAPKPIVSTSEQQPMQTARTERSSAVVASPEKTKKPSDESVSAATTSASETSAQDTRSGADIRDADSLTTLSTKSFTYPASDRAAHRSGTVFLVAKIKSDGAVTDVRVERTSGSKSMDDEAVKTFKQWKFSPEDAGYVRKAVQFVLKNEDAESLPDSASNESADDSSDDE